MFTKMLALIKFPYLALFVARFSTEMMTGWQHEKVKAEFKRPQDGGLFSIDETFSWIIHFIQKQPPEVFYKKKYC